MSYVVCSNSSNDNEVLSGISSANSFQNFFRSPLEIEPNSEVAIESVKINRQDKFDIVANDEFFVYFGEELTSSVLSGSVTTNGVKIDLGVGTYDRGSFAIALQNAINVAPLNPAIFGKCQVSIKTDANGLFEGFKFDWGIRTTADMTDISASITAAQMAEGNATTIKYNLDQIDASSATRAFEYNAGTQTLNCCATRPTNVLDYESTYFLSDCVARPKLKPLANANGHFVVDLTAASSASNSWLIGLSKPTSVYTNFGYPRYITETSADSGAKQSRFLTGGVFCDYWVEWSNACATTGGIDKLSVKHWGKNDNPKQWTIQEIEYWNNASSDFNGAAIDTTKMNASGIRYLIYKLEGNQLVVYVSQTPTIIVGKSWYLVDSAKTSGTTDSTYNFPPLSNSEEFLSPVLAMTASGQTMTITDYQTYDDISPYSFATSGSFRISSTNLPKGDNPLIAGSDWWSQAAVTERGKAEIRFNELRPANLWYGNTAAPTNYRYKGLNASTSIDYNVVIIPNKEAYQGSVSAYAQQLYVIPIDQNNANMGRVLGFETAVVVKQSLFGTPLTSASSVSFSSFNAGEFAVSSCFVRINDLTIRSYNGAKSSRSQIIYHIPRFTNDGKQYGELYFNAPEKTYLKLNNTDKMTLNSLKIDIVDRMERVVDDLGGATIVCLHFRPSLK